MAFDFRLPECMRSVDFRTFEGLYKICLGAIKHKIDAISNLNSADKCVVHMLPLLAGKLGMEYKNYATPDVNREIIRNWWWAIRHKGTEQSMKLMATLALLTFNTNPEDMSLYSQFIQMNLTPEYYDGNTKVVYNITISYQPIPEVPQEVQEQRMLEFINTVRPAGCGIIDFIPAQFAEIDLNIQTMHEISGVATEYDTDTFSSTESEIGFSEVPPKE
jgi:hypothetical protein